MRAFVGLVAIVLATAAAGAAALIVLPAPSKGLALAAIVASERSAFVMTAGVIALLLVIVGLGPTSRSAAAVTALFALGAMAVSALPLIQAHQVAESRGVELDLAAYLRARIDTEGPGRPDRSITYATVGGHAGVGPGGGEVASKDGPPLQLDVYLPPKRPQAPGRALLVVHGGFWAAGRRGEAALESRRLADAGITVFDADYRIAPQPNWRTAVGDVKCAIGWIKSHPVSDDWNIDPAKMAVLGRSAGGHLALMAAYTDDDSDLPPSCPTNDSSVEAVIALYAPTDLTWAYANPSNPRAADSRARMRGFLDGTPDTVPDRYRALSPVRRVTPNAPRTLLVQGGRDQLVDPEHLDLLADRLHEAGVGCETLLIPYAQHAFDFVVGGFSSQLLEHTILEFLNPAPVGLAESHDAR